MRTTIAVAVFLISADISHAVCLPDGSTVSIKGTVVKSHVRGSENAYALRTSTPYCIADAGRMEIQNRRPTKQLLLQGDDLHRYAGKAVTINGMLLGSGAGIPMLTSSSVTP